MACNAGATIVDARDEVKVKPETIKVAVHLRLGVQFSGLRESSGPEKAILMTISTKFHCLKTEGKLPDLG